MEKLEQENSRYYIPGIEEFHVGFEYEYYAKPGHCIDSPVEESEKQWIRTDDINALRDFNICDVNMRAKHINRGNIRVKYLDKQDIEELGWIFVTNFGGSDEMCFDFLDGKYTLSWFKHLNIVIHGIKNQWDDPDRRFNGYIKNKSELRYIMKKIGIKL